MITPDQLAKSGSEHGHQAALFCWAAVAHIHGFAKAWKWAEFDLPLPTILDESKPVPALRWLHAIPNGGVYGDDEKARAIRGGKMIAEGVRKGVADVFLPVPIRAPAPLGLTIPTLYCGLYIEMKKPDLKPKREGSAGGVSAEQKEFGEFVKGQGFGWIVCYDWREAAKTIERYLNWGK